MNNLVERLRALRPNEDLEADYVEDVLREIEIEDLEMTYEGECTLLHLAVEYGSLVLVDEICNVLESAETEALEKILLMKDSEGRNSCLLALLQKKYLIVEIFANFTNVIGSLLNEIYENGLGLIDYVLEVEEVPNLLIYSKFLVSVFNDKLHILSNGDSHLHRLCSINANELDEFSRELQVNCIDLILSESRSAKNLLLHNPNKKEEQPFMLAIRSGSIELITMLTDLIGLYYPKEIYGDDTFGSLCLEMLCPINRDSPFDPKFASLVLKMFNVDIDKAFKSSSIYNFVFTIDCFGTHQDEFVLWLLKRAKAGVTIFSQKIREMIECGALESLKKVMQTLEYRNVGVQLEESHLSCAIEEYMRNVEKGYKFNESIRKVGKMFKFVVEDIYEDETEVNKLAIAQTLHPFRFRSGFYSFCRMTKICGNQQLIKAIMDDNFLAAETIVTFIELRPRKVAPLSTNRRRIVEQKMMRDNFEHKCCCCQGSFLKNQKRKLHEAISSHSYLCENCYFADLTKEEGDLEAMEFARRSGKTKFFNLIKFSLSEVGVFLRKSNLMFLAEFFISLKIESLSVVKQMSVLQLQEVGIPKASAHKLLRAIKK